ncbi:Cytochrome b [Habropoda laboriosa]|uniref:Cytochrome b n=1 Tax=Habropoda laboriosa TaxID=597456 RepID=A0A0L7RJ65_9HYME|nr:Cytochrome b [Habropoda laboriosa]
MGYNRNVYKIYFHPYFTIKDILIFVLILLFFIFLICQFPYYLGDPDNFKIANSIMTPIIVFFICLFNFTGYS